MRGRLRAGPDDPGGGRGRSTACRPSRYPDLAALRRRDQRQPARRPRRRARRPRPSGSTSTAASTASSPTSTRSRARRARRCARTSATCCATAGSTRWSATSTSPLDAGRPRARQSWDREEVHQVFDTLEFRVLRDRLYADARERRSREAEARLRRRRRACSAPARWPAGSPSTRRPACRAGVAVAGTWGARHRRRPRRSPSRRPTARRRRLDPTELDRRRRGGARRPGWPTRRGPRSIHDAKGPMLALAARGWTLARASPATPRWRPTSCRPDQRSYDLADLALRYLHRELRAGRRADDGQLTPRRLERRRRRGRRRDAARRARCSTWPTRSTPSSSRRGGTALLADVELPLVDVLADDGAHRHRRRHRPPRRRSRRTSPPRCKRRRRGGVRA